MCRHGSTQLLCTPLAEASQVPNSSLGVDLAPRSLQCTSAFADRELCAAQIDETNSIEEAQWTLMCCRLLEQRLMRKLRFQTGEVYTCSVSASFGCEAPSRIGPLRGDIAINFSCRPDSGGRLSESALAEVEVLQNEGPTTDEVATELNLEQRSHETAIQENAHWLKVRLASRVAPVVEAVSHSLPEQISSP